MKRQLSLIALICSLLCAATPVQAVQFPDAQQTLYTKAAASLSQAGIIQGYGDGLLRPYNLLTRAEAVVLILRADSALSDEVKIQSRNMPDLPLFTDINQHAWYAPSIEVAFRH